MLVRGGGLRPVGLGEGRRFALWELASLAELALGETVEPEGLTVGGERRVRKRLGSAGREYVHQDAWSRRYWLTERSAIGAAIVGTVAVDTWPSGWDCLRISSLYVHPGARRARPGSTAFVWRRIGAGRRPSATTSRGACGWRTGSTA